MFLIDGYNLVYASEQWSDLMDRSEIEKARHDMLSCISGYIRETKRKTCVVFDGNTGHYRNPRKMEFMFGSINVLFTGREKKADEEIVDIVRSARDPNSITVVTSDREIRDKVVKYGGKTVKSQDFRIKIFESLKQKSKQDSDKKTYRDLDISYEDYMEMLKDHEKNNNN